MGFLNKEGKNWFCCIIIQNIRIFYGDWIWVWLGLQVARLFGPSIFEASKLKVLFLGVDEKKHPGNLPRTYTLTHSDITAKLTLAISQTINNSQVKILLLPKLTQTHIKLSCFFVSIFEGFEDVLSYLFSNKQRKARDSWFNLNRCFFFFFLCGFFHVNQKSRKPRWRVVPETYSQIKNWLIVLYKTSHSLIIHPFKKLT